MNKNKNQLPRNKFRLTFIIINSFIFSNLLVGLLTYIIVRSFQLESFVEVFPVFFIGVPLLAMGIVHLVLTIVASNRSFKEINTLVDAIDKVGDGDFSVRLELPKVKSFRLVFNRFNQMVNELNSIEILRTDFISNFSHEFKTPIVSIKGFAKLAKDKDTTEEERIEYLNIILQEIDKLTSLSNSTLLLSKLESQELVLEKEVYSLDEQIRETLVLLHNKWDEKNIEFDLSLEDTYIKTNKGLIQQLLINLIDNAIKFSHEDGLITIRLAKLDENIILKIKDEGIGIDEDKLKHIFSKFYQSIPSRDDRGIGLGLSIVKRITELTGGDITANSKLNEGTEFIISLPMQ